MCPQLLGSEYEACFSEWSHQGHRCHQRFLVVSVAVIVLLLSCIVRGCLDQQSYRKFEKTLQHHFSRLETQTGCCQYFWWLVMCCHHVTRLRCCCEHVSSLVNTSSHQSLGNQLSDVSISSKPGHCTSCVVLNIVYDKVISIPGIVDIVSAKISMTVDTLTLLHSDNERQQPVSRPIVLACNTGLLAPGWAQLVLW